MLGGDEVDRSQLEAVTMLKRYARCGPVALAPNDYNPLIYSKPNLERVSCPVRRRRHFSEAKALEERERLARRRHELQQRGRIGRIVHLRHGQGG